MSGCSGAKILLMGRYQNVNQLNGRFGMGISFKVKDGWMDEGRKQIAILAELMRIIKHSMRRMSEC